MSRTNEKARLKRELAHALHRWVLLTGAKARPGKEAVRRRALARYAGEIDQLEKMIEIEELEELEREEARRR